MSTKVALSLFDQAILSISNFATAVLLARAASQDDFGIYVLIFSYILLTQSIQAALITAPMSTLGAYRTDPISSTYLGSLLTIQLALSLTFSAVCVALVLLFLPALPLSLAVGIGFLIFFWQTQEFFRKLMFTKIDVAGALINDSAGHGLQLALIVSSYFSNMLTLSSTISIMSATMFLATIVGLFQCRGHLQLGYRPSRAFADNWRFGKWLLASNTLTWTSSYAFNYLVAFFIGLQGPAILQSCGNLMGPTNIVMNGIENVVPPAAAKKYQTSGIHALNKYLRVVGLAGLCGLAVYVLAAGTFSGYILNFLYRGTYNDHSSIVWLLGLSYLLSYIMRVSAFGLRTLQETKHIFYAYLVSSVFTVLVGVPMVMYYSVEGAATGSVLTAGITAAIVTLAFRRESKKVQRVT
jgi:O-antigen/teichoic acid export membrane protein